MKHFLNRLLLFLGLLLLYGVVMFGVNEMIYRLTPLPVEPTRLLIAGDSHLMYGLDPEAFERAENISRNAEPYAVTFWKLREVMPAMDPDTVILTIAPGNFSSYSDAMFLEPASATYQFNVAYRVLDLPVLVRDFPVNWKRLITTGVRKSFLYPNLNPYAYIGGYLPVEGSKAGTAPRRIQRHFRMPGAPPATVGKTMVQYLDSILYLCAERQVTPIVVATPHQQEYLKAVPPPIMAAYRDKFRELQAAGIATINGLRRPAYPEAHFQDADHLNRFGAAAFSAEVALRLSTGQPFRTESK